VPHSYTRPGVSLKHLGNSTLATIRRSVSGNDLVRFAGWITVTPILNSFVRRMRVVLAPDVYSFHARTVTLYTAPAR
jgi:hypothetical protein